MRIIGDIHGHVVPYERIISECDHSIQVGDFGWGFFGEHIEDYVNKLHADGNHRFIRGNHDDPTRCREAAVGWIPDGTVDFEEMYIGGAWSIDQAWRTIGLSWWPDEELSQEQFEQVEAAYLEAKPSLVITHDAPHNVAHSMFFDTGLCTGEHKMTRTAMNLQYMFEQHQPDMWVFGHWHHTTDITIEGTKFQCLGELDYIDI